MNAKEDGVLDGLANWKYSDYRVAWMAPTRPQAKAIYWEDVKLAVPNWAIRAISETELSIRCKNGTTFQVLGMDKPARVEGSPLDRAYCDEAGDWKPGAFFKHVYPALDTLGRPGRAWVYGVTRSGGDFLELAEKARDPLVREYEWFSWPSSSLLTPEQIAEARANLDPLTYRQEYEAEFVGTTGGVYYPFDRQTHGRAVEYVPGLPLIITLDYNVEPGSGNILQEQRSGTPVPGWGDQFTACLDEIHIPVSSNTEIVCNEICRRYEHHRGGHVYVYGDFYGGQRRSSGLAGTDWEIVKNIVVPYFGSENVWIYNDKANPPVPERVQSVNRRLRTADGLSHFAINTARCPETVKDFERVCWKEGVYGEIEKRDLRRTHWADGVGYYIWNKFPIVSHEGWHTTSWF